MINMTTGTMVQTHGAVYSFDVDDLPDDEQGREFAQRIYAMIEEYQVLAERRRQSDIARYSSEHEALIIERRKLTTQESELDGERSLLTSQAAEVEKAVRDAAFSLMLVRKGVPEPEWAIQSDWDAHNARVAAAEEVLKKAESQRFDHNASVADWRERRTNLIDQIGNIALQVKEVWVKLEHAKGHQAFASDHQTGLPL